MVKFAITLPTSVEGGGDVKACNLFKSLLSIGLKVTGISLSYSVSPYFLKHLSIDFLELLKDRLQKLLDERTIIISIYPYYTYNLIRVKKLLKSDGVENLFVLHMLGGNDFSCPLYTEVCPYYDIHEAYGYAPNLVFFMRKCIPHILRSRRYSVSHIFIWPKQRKLYIDHLDGILASRSIYLKGCMLAGFEKCRYVGFGIDTGMFKYRDKEEVIALMRKDKIKDSLQVAEVHANTYGLYESLEADKYIVIGYIGSVYPKWKNVELILYSFKRLIQKMNGVKKVKLLIVARHADLLLDHVTALPTYVRKNVFLFNKIPYKLIKFMYNIVDVFVNPSLLDSLEYNTLEALSSGNIVLLSNRGSVRDLKFLGFKIHTFEPSVLELTPLLQYVIENLDYEKKTVNDNVRKAHSTLNLNVWGLRILDALRKLNIM